MVELLLKRYLWLIDTLKRGGEMTYDDIAERWSKSSVNDNGSALSKRTFYNHCQAVGRHFGIDIQKSPELLSSDDFISFRQINSP